MKRKANTISSEEFDTRFDNGEDVSEFIDFGGATRDGLEIKRVNVDMPQWMVSAADKECVRLGVSRQAVLKMWIARCADEAAA